jgi:hypothetical protein
VIEGWGKEKRGCFLGARGNAKGEAGARNKFGRECFKRRRTEEQKNRDVAVIVKWENWRFPVSCRR